MNEDIIDAFLKALQASKETALLVAEELASIVPVTKQLEEKGVIYANDGQEILDALTANKSVFLVVAEENFSKELYDIVSQYSARQGMIQLLNPLTHIMRAVRYNPKETKLILVMSRAQLEKIECRMPIQDKVGITEIIS